MPTSTSSSRNRPIRHGGIRRLTALIEEAWTAIRGGFVEMFKLAEQGSFDEIDAIQPLASANALRAKATYMYFPEELLPDPFQGSP